MNSCLNCGAILRPLHDDIADYEYLVDWKSKLVSCPDCGLVTHDPPIEGSDVPLLYPNNYHAYTGGSSGRGLYWKLRKALAQFTMRGVLPLLPRGAKFLEVGCGNGSFLRLLAEARPDLELHGVDIVDTHITGIDRFTFHHGMLEALELPEGDSWTTIAGLCSSLAGRIPTAGTKLSLEDGTTIEVMEASPRQVRLVRVVPKASSLPALAE